MKKYNSNFSGIKTTGNGTAGGPCCSTLSLTYTLNYGEDKEKYVSVRLPYHINSSVERPKRSTKLVDESSEFSNGYKVVETENGEYTYVRQEDGKILSARFDIAGDFNEYGLAMVGKNGNVSWINKNMEYLTTDGVFVTSDPENRFEEFKGWGAVTHFSKNNASLSRLYSDGYTSYLSTNGEIMRFNQLYGNEEFSEYPKTSFRDGKDFNEQGYAFTASDMVLLATGYCLCFRDMIEISKQNGWLKQLMDNTAKLKRMKAPDNKENN